MSDEKKLELQAKRWSDNKERAYRNAWYAVQRMDLLIISISGGGLYSSFELVKFCVSNKQPYSSAFILIACGLFVTAVMINFISQFLGMEVNNKDAVYNNNELLSVLDEKELNKEKQIRIDERIQCLNRFVDITNYTSSILMVLGIVSLVAFISNTF